jgi:hypothetical protein
VIFSYYDHVDAIEFFIGTQVSILLAITAFFLTSLYILQFFLLPRGSAIVIVRSTRRNRLIMRSINWAIFGLVFLLFGEVIRVRELSTWRATARVALIFLMLPEIAYQLTVLMPLIERPSWMKR